MQRTRTTLAYGLVVMLSCATVSWATAATPSLYERLGGDASVTVVVSDTIDRAAHDPRLKRSFAKVNLARLKRSLVEQLCELTGGPCKYEGDTMREAHAGLGITQAEFYGMVQVLKESMERRGIQMRERNELLALLAPMKRDVVER